MAAPVVPIHEASTVPISIIIVFTTGVPSNVPLSTIPPEIVKKLNRRRIVRTEPLLKALELKTDCILADRTGFIRYPVREARADSVTIWEDRCNAVTADPAAAEWFTGFLGTPCRLVRMPASTVRQVDLGWAVEGDRVGFADGFPFLLISQSSLDELNRRLDEPVPMDRFRPNVVVEGGEPFAEDGWAHVTMGEVGFRVVKPCARCVITTTDQLSGERGREPLRTLATYRRFGNKVLFGQNLIHNGTGVVRIGDSCEVMTTNPP